MDRIHDSTRYSYQWLHENQNESEGGPSGADRPSSSHTIDPDYLHHPQHDQAGTSFTPHPAHFPSTSEEYIPRNDNYHQFQPIARPRAIPYDPANQWQYELYSPAVSSHPDTRQFPFDEPSSSYAQNREEYGNPTNFHSQPPHHTSEDAQEKSLDYSRNRPYASSFSSYHEQQRHPFGDSHQPQFQPIAPTQAIPFASSNPWQLDPYASSSSSYHEPQHFPFGETHQPQFQPIVRPQARPFDAANQWQYELYSPANVSHPNTQQPHENSPEVTQEPPFDFWGQQQLEPAAMSSHPEPLHYSTNVDFSLSIHKTEAQRLAPYMEESSKKLRDELVPFNHLMSSNTKMLIHQFRILPALEKDVMRVDDVSELISFMDGSVAQTRIKSLQKAVRKYQFGTILTFNIDGVDHCRFQRDPNSTDYPHLIRALEILSPLEQTFNLKVNTVSFCRSLHYLTNRPRVSREVMARDFDIKHGRVADLMVQFSRAAKNANIGYIKFKSLDKSTGKFFEPDGEHGARYYHWKGLHNPPVNINQSIE